MKRSGMLIAAVILLASLAVGGYFGWRHLYRSGTALVGGKTPAAWLEELRSPDPAVGMKAAETLVDLGEPALPILLEARKESDLRAHRRAVFALVSIGPPAVPGLVAALDRGGARVETALVRIGAPALPELETALASPTRARHTARVLGAMGDRARPAASALVGLLQDAGAGEEARAEAAAALGQIGPEKTATGDGPDVAGVLAVALAGPPRVRLEAARALAQMGPAPQMAIPSLALLAADMDVQSAATACEALGQVGGPAAVPPLLSRLLKADGASKSAALALARLGPAARLAVAPLIACLKSDKEDGRFARAVLERLGSSAIRDLEAALTESAPVIRRSAAEVLGLMGPRAAAAVPALVKVLEDRDPSVSIAAAQALVRIDPTKATAAVPILVRLFKGKDEKVADQAALVLAEHGPDARSAVPELLAGLKEKNEKLVRRSAFVLGRLRLPDATAALRSALTGPAAARPAVVQALGQMGEAGKPALPELLAALKDASLRPQAALAIVRIAPEKATDVGRALTEDLGGEGPARAAALAMLRVMPQVPAEVIPALRPLLSDPTSVRPALEAVRRLDAKSAEAIIPDLVGLLSSTDGEVRQEAGWLLRLIGKPALPALKRALTSPTPKVRAAAAWTLDWSPLHGPADDPGFLLPLLKDADETVRQSAAATCGGLGLRSPESVRTMLDLLGSPEAEMRRAAVRALRVALIEQAEPIIPYLIECLYDPDDEVRQATALALRFAGTALTAMARAALKEALLDVSPAVRLSAADTLATTSSAGEAELAPVLLSLARRTDARSRGAVLEVLFRISPERAREMQPEVEADLRAESVEERITAAEWLVRLDARATGKAVAFLVGILNGWDTTARSQAAAALEQLGPATREALPALKRRAECDENDAVRAAARRAYDSCKGKKPASR
jgi:HEAT repeat protein